MRKLFLSYACENKAEVEQLQRRLDRMGYGAWFDGRLYGGSDVNSMSGTQSGTQ